MNVTLTVPDYEERAHLRFEWDGGFEILLERNENEVVIKANTPGLISLARHLLTLAQLTVPAGSHLHLTEESELEEGSGELIIEKSDITPRLAPRSVSSLSF